MPNGMLNSVIKFDLHIHSEASKYKESKGIVDNSNKHNLATLLNKLNEHDVALFSITDHNRFDPELYIEINKILSEKDNPYPNVKAVLAGVEFDVILDDGMDKCHIIAIFETDNCIEKFSRIDTGIRTNLLKDAQEAYSRKDFENVLKEIGLNTILIASQRKDIQNQSGKHNSLSDSAINVEQIIRMGYINALEFQKPKVEGIILNSLRKLSLPITLFSGSDCHDWEHYPFHDSVNQNKEFHHSKAKMLPTFQGLLMAVTSPETRFNRTENTNTNMIESIRVKEHEIPLVNGINAIIGENGSGKTTLLKVINGDTSESYVKKLVRENQMSVKKAINPRTVKYIEQGEIIKRFNENSLFSAEEDNNFKELDTTPFREVYTSYAEGLKRGIESHISRQQLISSLADHEIAFIEGMLTKNYYVDVVGIEALESIVNPHEKASRDLKSILDKLVTLVANDSFVDYKEELERIILELRTIYDDIERKKKQVDYKAKTINIVHGCVNDYLSRVKENSSAKDREIREYHKKKERFINAIFQAADASLKRINWPSPPPILEGVTTNPKQGFQFSRQAAYNRISMLDDFYLKMFVKSFGNLEVIQKVNTFDMFVEAVRNCTSVDDINEKWKENFERFINDAIKTSEYILEGTDQQIGNTLGEMSLSYYKYFTQDDQGWKVLIVDQPEDNISNNNISQKLIKYLSGIRHEKQIIFVTHNPLLVVNLDVDNVIFVKNENGDLSVHHGCLEYVDEKTNIIELIANNMDGGKETIEKRLKIYG